MEPTPSPLSISEHRHKSALEALERSSEEFDKTQVETIEASLYVVEKMAFYSAGAISLSVTFLGYLLENYSDWLSYNFLSVPLYFILYASWVLSAITIITGIGSKRFDAFYRYYAGILEYFKKNKKQQEMALEFARTGGQIILKEGETLDDFKKETKSRISQYERKIVGYEKKQNLYFSMKIWVQNTAVVSFIFSILLLMSFTILITNAIISG